MKILICPDKFKGSLTAVAAASAIGDGVKRAIHDADITTIPMADGGDGTMDAFLAGNNNRDTSGEKIAATVIGPMGEPVDSCYAVLDDGTCVIEMAAASGLALVEGEKDILKATSYGTGQLIAMALDAGYRRLIVGLGGSASNDGGMGILSALGVVFSDEAGAPMNRHGDSIYGTAGDMLRVGSMDTSGLHKGIAEAEIHIASDVKNTLCGPNGASAVFGPQKGASSGQVTLLDEGLYTYGRKLGDAFGMNIIDMEGAGAAGGAGGALLAIGGRMRSGAEMIIEHSGLEELVAAADIVITGEGRTDASTADGKAPQAIAALAAKYAKPCICLCGAVGSGYEKLYDIGMTAMIPIVNSPMGLDEAMKNAYMLLEQAAKSIARIVASIGGD